MTWWNWLLVGVVAVVAVVIAAVIVVVVRQRARAQREGARQKSSNAGDEEDDSSGESSYDSDEEQPCGIDDAAPETLEMVSELVSVIDKVQPKDPEIESIPVQEQEVQSTVGTYRYGNA